MEVTDSLHTLATTFCGVGAHQSWADFLMWERLLNLHPELDSIVELGTGNGGFSLYLSTQAAARGLDFTTYDKAPPDVPVPGHRGLDVFGKAGRADVLERLHAGRTILHCDNGDKPRELKLFASRLTPGSICVVHDWGVEAGPGDVPANLEAAHEDLVAELGSLSWVGVAA